MTLAKARSEIKAGSPVRIRKLPGLDSTGTISTSPPDQDQDLPTESIRHLCLSTERQTIVETWQSCTPH